ncbi:MAG: ribosome maturation factor RimM [Butyrivibrio sp.]|nr:ribosome maturation factor RimM [Butyrivibrio sp.]
MTEKFQVGVIASTHGLKGEVNVFPTTDDPQRFKKLKKVTLNTPREGAKELEIEGVKFFKKFVIVKFKGLDRIEDVEKLRGAELTINREDAMPLDENEYYTADLIGLNVYDEDDKLLGEIINVIQTGANDVYEMKRDESIIDSEAENGSDTVLIPAIKDCIKEVDVEKGKMVIHVMKGLL